MFVKICGVTNDDDALLAVALGADAIGFIFAPSTRQVAPGRVHDITRRLPPEALTVGVFRNEARERVVELVARSGVKAAQLHGHESAEDTRWVAERVPTVIKAFPAGHPGLDHFDDYGAFAALVDSPVPGSGEVFDWALAEGAPIGRRLILAGGLDPDNVALGIERVRPWGVDVASGVEARPGHKDPRKLRRFIEAARRAAASLPEPDTYSTAEGEFRPYDWEDDQL